MERQELDIIISNIGDSLRNSFALVDSWFGKPAEFLSYVPTYGGWSAGQILEHISLTNHFLLILITKGTRKALERLAVTDLEKAVHEAGFNRQKLDEVGKHQAFQWIRPEHMEPNGERTLPQIRSLLREQLAECQDCLRQLAGGAGVLHHTTMTVNNLGKLNVYEYLYFLSMHARRHHDQMLKIESDFESHVSS